MDFSFGKNTVSNELGEKIGEFNLSDTNSIFKDDIPLYFGQWAVITDLKINSNSKFKNSEYAEKIINDLTLWAISSKKSGILFSIMSTKISGLSGDEIEFFYQGLGFRPSDFFPNFMEKKLLKPMVFNLFTALKRLGFHKEAADLREIIPSSITEDPLTVAVALRELNPNAFEGPDDDIEVDFDFIDRVLNRAGLYGFGGECGAAAVAINRVLFDNKGSLTAFVNKYLHDVKDRMVGHVVVKWKDSYWDSDREKSRLEMESFGSLDRYDSDYSFPKDVDETEVREIILSEEDVLDIFEGCNLNSMIEALNLAKEEVQSEL
jgi:hypothetical protein